MSCEICEGKAGKGGEVLAAELVTLVTLLHTPDRKIRAHGASLASGMLALVCVEHREMVKRLRVVMVQACEARGRK